MKELSIEEKARAYDKVIDKIGDAVEAGTIEQGFAEWLFPELKESKDEKIRRNIIAALKGEGYYDCDLTDECIEWVEKQGHVKESQISQHENEICKENDDSLTDEDERIRKAILNYFTKCWGNCRDDVCGIHVEDAIAWLEKQEWIEAGWTMQDEEELDIAIKTLEEAGQYSSANWLKNVCLVPQPKQEWSEEDGRKKD